MKKIPNLAIIYLSVAILNLGFGMILPILPLYAQTYGASSSVIGLMVGAVAMGRLVFQGPGGYLADTYPNEKIAAIGISLYVPSMLLMALLPNPYVFIGLRFLEGVAEGIAIPALYAVVATHSPEDKIGVAFGLFTSFATAGLAIGPVLGGFFTSMFGPRLLFLVTAGTAFGVALLIFNFNQTAQREPSTASRRRKRMSPLEALRALTKSGYVKTLLTASSFSFLTKFAFAVTEVAFPLYLAERLHIGSDLLGFIFTLNFILYSFGQPFAGWLGDKLRKDQDILICGIIIGGAFLLLPLAPSFFIFSVLFGVEAFAASWVTVGIRRLIGRALESTDTGKGYGITGAIGDLGALIGPLIAGISYQLGPSWPFVIVGSISILCVLGTAVVMSNRMPPRDVTVAYEE
jgi:MFS family permease